MGLIILMLHYLLGRLLQGMAVLFLVSVIGYGLILATGDPMAAYNASPYVSASDVQRLRERYGLDQPVYIQYVRWLTNMLQGDWGRSYVAQQREVSEMLRQRFPNTLLLVISAYLMTLVIAVPIGILSAIRHYSVWDYLFTGLSFVGLSIPVFWLGLILMWIFAVQFKLWGLPYLPTGGMYDLTVGRTPGQLALHLILPSVTLASALVARYVRYIRAAMLEVIQQDYIRTARAKGLSEGLIMVRHALKNAAIPVVSLMGIDLPLLLSGTVVTESIFAWPGMGRLFFEHSLQVDVPVLMAVLLLSSTLIIAGSIVADVAYGFLDPRIRTRERAG
jgi:peptide/nickel transport system permease protein